MNIVNLIVCLMIGAGSKGEELVVNGAFEQSISVGWTQEVEGFGAYIGQASHHDGDGDYEVEVSTEAGPHCTTYAYLWQIVNIPSAHNVDFSGKAKFNSYGNYSGEGSWAIAQLIVKYQDSGGNDLGDTRIYNRSYGSSSSNPTHHCISAGVGTWNNYSFNIGEEIDNNLSGINSANVKKLKIYLTANAFGAAICVGSEAGAAIWADDISVETRTSVSVTIASPNGGETWAGGSTHNITWTCDIPDSVHHYKLLYSTDGGSNYPNTIANNIPNTNTSYSWTLPVINSSTVKVKIEALNASNEIIGKDESDNNFSIQTYPTLTSPNGGETWAGGTTHQITWSVVGTEFDSYRLLYSTNSGANYSDTIASGISPSSISYNWILPAINSTTCRVKVQILNNLNNVISEDASDGNFTIQLYTTLISPNGGESWTTGSTHPITWSTVGQGFDSYKLLYSSAVPDSGWDTADCSISSPHPYPTSYDTTWVISHPGAQKIKIHFSEFILKVYGSFVDTVYLYTQNDTQIAYYTGNKGAFWADEVPGDTVKVRLVTNWAVNEYGFDIDKYAYFHVTEGYGSIIADNISPDSSSWSWTLPTTPCTTAKVKVQILDAESNIISYDESDNYFEIVAGGPQEDTAIVSIPNDTVRVGSSNNIIYIHLENSMPVAGVQIVLEHFPLLSAHPAITTPRSNMMDISSSIGTDSIQVLLSPGSSSDTIACGTGYIIEIPFDISSSATPGDSTLLHIKKLILSDTDETAIPFHSVDGWLFFKSPAPIQVTVISPDSGEVWITGTADTIKWDATAKSGIDSISIYLSLNSGSSYPYTIAHGIPNNSSHIWTVMDTFSTDCRVKVGAWDLQGNYYEDESNYNFVIAYGIKANVNADAEINILDVIRTIGIIQGYGAPPTAYELWSADVNNDEEVNILDVVAIVHIIQSSSEKSYVMRHSANENHSTSLGGTGILPDTAFVSIPDCSGEAGTDSNFVYVNLENPVPVAGVQIRILFDTLLTAREAQRTTRSEMMSSINSAIDAGQIQIMLYSSSLDTIASGEGAILTIPFYISSNATPGDSILLHINKLILSDMDGKEIPSISTDSWFHITESGTEIALPLPTTYELSQVYPNPSVQPVIRYQIPIYADKTNVSLRIYDADGRLVKTLYRGEREPGYYQEIWDMRDDENKQLPNGIYFYKLETSEFTATKKLIIVR